MHFVVRGFISMKFNWLGIPITIPVLFMNQKDIMHFMFLIQTSDYFKNGNMK